MHVIFAIGFKVVSIRDISPCTNLLTMLWPPQLILSLHVDYKKCYSYPFDLKIKHWNSFILNDSNRVFLHTSERILIGSKICILKAKLIHALLIRKSTKPCYIRFTACIVMLSYYNNRANKWYYMPITPFRGILVYSLL